MLTKGAIGNLINRYRAVLTKCNLINTFGSLAVASMLVLGGAGVAGAVTISAGTVVTSSIKDSAAQSVIVNGTAENKVKFEKCGINTSFGGILNINHADFTGSSNSNGGAIYVAYPSVLDQEQDAFVPDLTPSSIKNSTFTGNSASSGGAIFNRTSSLTVSDSTFTGNSASGYIMDSNPKPEQNFWWGGGAILNGAVEGSKVITTLNLEGTNTFTDNTGYKAGAIHNTKTQYGAGVVNFNGTAVFSGNKDNNGIVSDIYNEGTLNFNTNSKTEMEALENVGGLVNVSGGKLAVSDSFTSTGGVSGPKTSSGTESSGVHALFVENGEASLSGTTNINVESADRVRAVRNEGGTLTMHGDVTITAKSTAPSVFTLGFDNRGTTTFTGTKTSISAIGLGDNSWDFGQGYAVQSVGGELNFNADTTSLAGYASKVSTDHRRITNAILLTAGTKVAFNGEEATLTAENDGSNTAQAVCFSDKVSNSLTFNADKTDIISKSAYGVAGINGNGSHRIEFKKGVTTITSAVTGNGVANFNSNAIGIRQTNGASLEVAEDATLNINVYGASYEQYGTAGVESGAQNTINGNLNIVVKSGQTVEGYNEFNASTPATSGDYAYSNAYGIRLRSGGTLTAGENSKLTIDVSEGYIGKAYAMHVADGANVTLGETEITAKAQSGHALGFYIKGSSTGIFDGPVSLTAESEKKNGYGLYLAGSADTNLKNDPKLTFNSKTTITVGSETNAANTGWQQGVRLEYSSAEFNDGLDIKVTDKGTSGTAYVAAISALGDKIDGTDAFSSITIKGDSDINVEAADKEALGINASGGIATAIESGTVDINVVSNTGAYGANVQYGGKITSEAGTTLNLTAEASKAYALYLDLYAGGVGSVDIDGALNLTAKGKESGVALGLVEGATADFSGTTTLNASATDAANAHAISGAGTVTNSGVLTVESGSLSGFTGTYTQTAGSTDITKATDFFGGSVAIDAGSLTVDAGQLGEENSTHTFSAAINSKLALAKNATLNVDFANLAEKTYTAEQYNDAKAYLLTGDEGNLVFLNATLEIEEEKGESLVAGADKGTDGYTLGTPTVVSGSHDHVEDGTEIPHVPTADVKVVDPEDPHGDALNLDAPLNLVEDKTIKNLVVGNGTEDANLNVQNGATVTFAGGDSTDDAPVHKENGDAVQTSFTVADGGTLNIGVEGSEENQKFGLEEVVVKGEHNVIGNGTETTEVSYGSLETSGTTSITNAAVTVKNLTIGGGMFVIDPAYVKADSVTDPVTGLIGVGDGSVLQIGEVEGLEELVKEAGFTTTSVTTEYGPGFIVDSGKAVLALGQAITLDEETYVDASGATVPTYGAIEIDGSKAADAFAPASEVGAKFAGNSLLVVTGNICSGSTAAITGTGTLTVESGAKLAISGAAANTDYTITSGFTTADVAGWTEDDLIINKMLTAEVDTATVGKVVVSTGEVQDASETFLGIIPVNGLNTMMQDGQFDVHSADAGVKFLSRAIDTASGYLAEDKIVDTVNEVSRAAVTAGVQNTALRIADAASNTVIGHLSLSQHDGSKSIHVDGADFWAAPMYGNLYTSGMVTDGASVRGQFGGPALGADLEAGQFLGGKFRLGAAINGGGGQSETKGTATSTQNDYDFGGLNFYAGWNNGALNIIGSVGYGFGNHEVEMGLPSSMGMGTAKADVDTTVFTADLRAEYQLKTDWVDLLPHAGVRYTALRTGAHNLKIGGDVLNSVERDTQNIVQFPVGVTLSKDVAFADWNVKPMVDVSVIPAAGDKKANTKVRFSGIDAVDGVNSRIMDSTSWAGTIGVQAEKGDFTLGLNYGVQASSNETDQNVQLKLGWKF